MEFGKPITPFTPSTPEQSNVILTSKLNQAERQIRAQAELIRHLELDCDTLREINEVLIAQKRELKIRFNKLKKQQKSNEPKP